ncbi:MAG: cob(I)yrinic acid a,c-diamide adenosyltransferase [Vicinamibacterales bacterium]|nr:ATP:cob(I)alamin adenosyltransferase [Acidobacteriota bacterium]MDP7295220.1 cob(I)yrinic acid a,c-diamide adenosyltransferase [Vicinamibacterales bacterium]MDP7471223.1 cob(I)yrinic acid a,c-diamide adenosyltransferase [Vicinamibacterales bacterium]HJO36976.1 cob(I)yrinic acid a,c-diamide adenosyltransferase [Vicinamibacterales bacterium]
MSIYTRTGDDGETGLFDGTRVPKSDPRVEACGETDEVHALLGLARAYLTDHDLIEMVIDLQRDLFAIGARLADPGHRIADRVTKIDLDALAVERLESWIDRLDTELPEMRSFVLAGGTPAGAALHVARTVCRRAERRIVGLGAGAVEPDVLRYVNRLSDLLFMLARTVNARARTPEVEW